MKRAGLSEGLLEMSLVLKVACPSCGSHQDSLIGTEVRCDRCGNDFRALGHGESSSIIISATPDELEHIPYSQRKTETPRSSASSLIISDPTLLDDLMLRDLPMKDNARWAGRVRLVTKLGQGGMGAVYRGYDESLALDVAVKILPIPPGGKEMHFADRFRMEARISAQINSANVVRTRDVGENGAAVYLVMDFIDGQTARQLLERKGLIPVPQTLQIVHDAALGMQAAHERGIVHRDIKPENILVANDGRVLLSDLGLAKASGSRISDSIMPITRMGLLLGTPEYMSPEQWDIGAHITPRSDIWAMGVTLWVLLTRRSPFEDSDLGQLAKKIKEAPLPDIHTMRPDVPPKVAAILYHCMAKNPQRRYMNSAALVSALNEAMLHPDQADDEFSVPPQTPSSLSISTNQDTLQVSHSAVMTPAAPAIAAKSGAAMAPAAKVVPIKNAAERPRANPTPIMASSKTKQNTDIIIRKKKRTVTRKLAWASIPAAAACAAFVYYRYGGFTPATAPDAHPALAAVATNVEQTKPAPSAVTEIALDVSAPQRVKIGDKAILSATLRGADDPAKYKIVWHTGKEEPQTGTDISALFEMDKEFDIRAIRVDSGKEVAQKRIRVETDLSVTAVEVAGNDPESPTRLEGSIGGGPGLEKTEIRWFEIKNPNETLGTKVVFEPNLQNALPGSRIYVFQARRKGAKDWNGAPSDKVPVVIQARVPAEFTQAMKNAEKFMKDAETSDTGSASQQALTDALECYATAQRVLPENADALHRKAEALRRARAEGDYAKLMSDSRERYYQAEVNGSDPYKKQQLLESALQPCLDAKTTLKANDLRVHPEVLSEIKRLQDAIVVCKTSIEEKNKALAEYDSRIKQARAYVKEAEKYQSLSVALPHWEEAWNNFEGLRKQYPKMAYDEGFLLELRKAQENYLKSYLFVKAGFIPARPEDTLYQKQQRNTQVNPSSSQVPTPTGKERGAILDP